MYRQARDASTACALWVRCCWRSGLGLADSSTACALWVRCFWRSCRVSADCGVGLLWALLEELDELRAEERSEMY